jgi:hypothetical protein
MCILVYTLATIADNHMCILVYTLATIADNHMCILVCSCSHVDTSLHVQLLFIPRALPLSLAGILMLRQGVIRPFFFPRVAVLDVLVEKPTDIFQVILKFTCFTSTKVHILTLTRLQVHTAMFLRPPRSCCMRCYMCLDRTSIYVG